MGMNSLKKRCQWAIKSELETVYHDQEWGVPQHDDQVLFELLLLEGAQAGLNWSTVLKKRQHYRQVLDNFDPEMISKYDEKKLADLLKDPGIIRNRLKIESTRLNAQAFLKIKEKHGSFDAYIWQFVEGKPIKNHWQTHAQLPSETPIAKLISKELKHHGFKFVGPTIVYAFMQAVGMVNDHIVSCFRYEEV
jgi:DNA-3-methyladenine glycosylase I